jgi:hypothetical protein
LEFGGIYYPLDIKIGQAELLFSKIEDEEIQKQIDRSNKTANKPRIK